MLLNLEEETARNENLTEFAGGFSVSSRHTFHSEKASAIRDEKIFRVRHARRAKQTVTPIPPPPLRSHFQLFLPLRQPPLTADLGPGQPGIRSS